MIGLLKNNGRAGRSDWRTLKLTAVDDSPNLLSISIGAAARQQHKNFDISPRLKKLTVLSPP
jgi:hypothetical protein